MKNLGIFLFVLCTLKAYAVTNFNYSNQLVVLYKVLDPLKVTVSQTEKMKVVAGKQKFKYSEVVDSKTPISVLVEAPFNQRDDILDTVYGTATLELENSGKFSLKSTNGNSEEIDARGYFKNEPGEPSKIILPLFTGTSITKYEGRTEIDAVFNENQKEMLMGTYKGVLRLNVTYRQ